MLADERVFELARRPARSRSASSRSFRRRSRIAPASRRPSARSLNSATREVQRAVGSPRASARAAATAATCARTMRQRTTNAMSRPPPRIATPTATSSQSDVANRAVDRRRRKPEADRPAGHRRSAPGGERRRALEQRGSQRAFGRAANGRGEIRVGLSAEVHLLRARPREYRQFAVHQREDAVGGRLLPEQDAAELRGEDARAEHVAQPAVARHRDADRDEELSRRRVASHRRHRRALGVPHPANPIVIDERRRFPEWNRGVHDHPRSRLDQADRLPARLQLQHAGGGIVEGPEVVGVDRGQHRERVERGDRALDFLVDRDRDRPRPLDVLAVDEVLLLLPGREDEPAGEEPERDDGHEEQEREDRSEADPAERLP